MEFKKFVELLALTHAKGNGKSIHGWCPFAKGDTLATIIESHNDRCIQSYQELNWEPLFIREYGEGIRVVPFDLSSLDNLELNDFKKISIILIDLDAVREETKKIEQIRTYILRDTTLVQVSRTPSVLSRLTDFSGLPVYPSDPEVMVKQATFENWLSFYFCKASQIFMKEYLDQIATVSPSKFDPLTNKVNLEALPDLVAKGRDATIIKSLSEKETVALARRSALQEFALNRIEVQVRSQTKFNRVLLDAIREPVVDMPIELGFQSPALRQVNLVELQVTQPMYEMPTEQRNIMLGFGIKEEVEPFVAVVPDQPTVWKSIVSLKDVVKTAKFSAELPVGLMRGMRGNL